MQKRDQYVEQHIQRLDAAINDRLKQAGIDSLAVLGLEEEHFFFMSELRTALRNMYEQGWKARVAEQAVAETV